MWRGTPSYLGVKKLWGVSLLKRTRGCFFCLFVCLRGIKRGTDWQTARSVNRAPLRHLELGIWKWRPLKSVVNFENPIPPSTSCQLWKFELCSFYHICHSLVMKLWHSKFVWQLCGYKPKWSSTCTFLGCTQCCSQREAEVWTRGTPLSFITAITIFSLMPTLSLFSLS